MFWRIGGEAVVDVVVVVVNPKMLFWYLKALLWYVLEDWGRSSG